MTTENRPPSLRSTFAEALELAGVLASIIPGPQPVILDRDPNKLRSTFASEIVTYAADGSTPLRVLCKYGPAVYSSGYGHRGGLRREVNAYQSLLAPHGLGAKFYGSQDSGDRCFMVLDYLDPAARLDYAEPETNPLLQAAQWVGRFHAISEAGPPPQWLDQYDEAYYQGWADRSLEFARQWDEPMPWLESVCCEFPRVAALLHASPQTVIHGEYTPHNLLIHDGKPYPIDWESVALGCGEIDLAAVTDNWPVLQVAAAKEAYSQVRWHGKPPHDFETTLIAARLYWAMRWAGNRADWPWNKVEFRYNQIREFGSMLGLI